MFFFKKNKNTESEVKRKEDVAKRGIKKMDAVITGAILGWVVASLYGVKKLKEQKEKEEKETQKADE